MNPGEREIPPSEWADWEACPWHLDPLPGVEAFGMWHEWFDAWLARHGPREIDAEAEAERAEEKRWRGKGRRGRRKPDRRRRSPFAQRSIVHRGNASRNA
ncbi:MAG: hypothetical protein K2W96_02415 [Gemmataceae bacterium]|nr:hypothetical protein [Gemmataceae bacterium]